jgi:hypothetical protein
MEFLIALMMALPFLFGTGHGGGNNHKQTQANNPRLEQNGKPTSVPTPALLPGLIGLGVAAFRKHKSKKDEAQV